MPDEKFTSSQRVTVRVPKSTGRRVGARGTGDLRRFGPFARPEDDQFPVGVVTVVPCHISTILRQTVINPPFLGSLMRFDQSNLWLQDSPSPAQVDDLATRLVHGSVSSDMATVNPPRGLLHIRHYSSPTESTIYRDARFCWQLPHDLSDLYGLSLRVHKTPASVSTTNPDWRKNRSAQARLDGLLASEDPDPDRVQALEWEVLETGVFGVGENTWLPELGGFDPRLWWSTDSGGFLRADKPIAQSRFSLSVTDGGHYFESFDPGDTDKFKVTTGPSYDTTEVSPSVAKKTGVNVLLLVPRLWKVTLTFSVEYEAAGPVFTEVQRTFVRYVLAPAAPQVYWEEDESLVVTGNFGSPFLVPSGQVATDVSALKYALEVLNFNNADLAAAIGPLTTGDGELFVNSVTFDVGFNARITVETGDLVPARALVGGIVTKPVTPFTATAGDVWIWRRTAGVHTSVPVITSADYNSFRSIGIVKTNPRSSVVFLVSDPFSL